MIEAEFRTSSDIDFGTGVGGGEKKVEINSFIPILDFAQLQSDWCVTSAVFLVGMNGVKRWEKIFE